MIIVATTQVTVFLTCATNNLTLHYQQVTLGTVANHRLLEIVMLSILNLPCIEVIKQGLKGWGKTRMGTGTGILRVKIRWGPGQGSL